eukprot:TRINITY_DN8276_c0_g1_i1.p1 TRINITY_DN8276_c0_g1~~TRINITY_DN8276_c0_g1_i1.p1  ORF type:complete len:278 (+),score=60.22 TRINITY_DN8276_c0_g1_i1:59-892(+)
MCKQRILTSEEKVEFDHILEKLRKGESRAVAAVRGTAPPPPSLDGIDMERKGWAEVPGWLRPAIASLLLKCEDADPNKEKPLLQEEFECVTVPEISLEEYAGILHESFPRLMCWVRALVMMHRFLEISNISITPLTIHRVLLTSVIATAHQEGMPADVDATWGIEESDLFAMEDAFNNVIGGDYSVTILECLRVLLPFGTPPSESIMAAGLIAPQRIPLSSVQRVEHWIQHLQTPPVDAPKNVTTSASSNNSIFQKIMSKVKVTKKLLPKLRNNREA